MHTTKVNINIASSQLTQKPYQRFLDSLTAVC